MPVEAVRARCWPRSLSECSGYRVARQDSLLQVPASVRWWPTAAVSPATCGGSRRNVCQVGLRWEPSGLVPRECNLAVNDDIELASAPGMYDHWTTSSRIKPCLHTDGIWFVVSGSAIKDNDRHSSFLSFPAQNVRFRAIVTPRCDVRNWVLMPRMGIRLANAARHDSDQHLIGARFV